MACSIKRRRFVSLPRGGVDNLAQSADSDNLAPAAHVVGPSRMSMTLSIYRISIPVFVRGLDTKFADEHDDAFLREIGPRVRSGVSTIAKT